MEIAIKFFALLFGKGARLRSFGEFLQTGLIVFSETEAEEIARGLLSESFWLRLQQAGPNRGFACWDDL